MVDKNELRAAFSARLHDALDDAGVRTRGRGVDIHNQLKSMGVFKTPQAVSKWLNGEAVAEADSIEVLSSWLRVRREWLQYGVLPKTADSPPHIIAIQGIEPQYRVPLLSWERATKGGLGAGRPHGHEGPYVYSAIALSPTAYALEVFGESMISFGQGRSYPPGTIIFIEPEVAVVSGDKVIAKMPNSDGATFKIYSEDAGRKLLLSVNPQYPTIDITNDFHIFGKVVGSFMAE